MTCCCACVLQWPTALDSSMVRPVSASMESMLRQVEIARHDEHQALLDSTNGSSGLA